MVTVGYQYLQDRLIKTLSLNNFRGHNCDQKIGDMGTQYSTTFPSFISHNLLFHYSIVYSLFTIYLALYKLQNGNILFQQQDMNHLATRYTKCGLRRPDHLQTSNTNEHVALLHSA